MQEAYKVTVLITFYNQSRYVDDAIRGVLNQKTDFKYHILAADDGSDDDTLEKIQSWETRYPEIISHFVMPRDRDTYYPVGMRPSQIRIALIRRVDTPYFIFLDGDDYWTDEHKLQTQVDLMEQPQYADCVGCVHHLLRFHEDKPENTSVIPAQRKIALQDGSILRLKEYWANRRYYSTDTILFRSDHIGDVDFDLLRDTFNDNLITFSFLQFGALVYLNRVWGVYRQNDRGIFVGADPQTRVIREWIGKDMETRINPAMKIASIRRHLPLLLRYHKSKGTLIDRDTYEKKGFREIAEQAQLETLRRAAEGKPLFMRHMWSDYVYLQAIWFLQRVNNKVRAVRRRLCLITGRSVTI